MALVAAEVLEPVTLWVCSSGSVGRESSSAGPFVSAGTAGCVCVRSAVVDTLGADVVDVFYLVDPGARPLDPERAGTVREQVSDALGSRD